MYDFEYQNYFREIIYARRQNFQLFVGEPELKIYTRILLFFHKPR